LKAEEYKEQQQNSMKEIDELKRNHKEQQQISMREIDALESNLKEKT